jgi:hypothetical protein
LKSDAPSVSVEKQQQTFARPNFSRILSYAERPESVVVAQNPPVSPPNFPAVTKFMPRGYTAKRHLRPLQRRALIANKPVLSLACFVQLEHK